MKNLKKSLALVLAIALVFSLVVFANAEFTDADQINPKFADAVGVMNGLGIIKGYDTGAFGPQDTLTRGQAMKIITYLKLGPKAADNLKTSVAPFNDVPATAWEAPFVSYCKTQKITAGYGDGNFGKDDKLSGFAFAKFLLVALGYGAQDEYIGDDWQIAVATDALKLGLFDGIEEYLTDDPLPREVAAQAALIATQITPVQYSKLLEMYTSAGAPLFESPLKFYPEPVLDETDKDGRPVTRYYDYDGKVIYEKASEAVYTTAAGTKAAENANKNWNAIAADFDIKVNGVAKEYQDINKAAENYYAGATIEYFGKPTPDGKINITAIAVTDYTYAKVTKVVEGKEVYLDGTKYDDKVSLKALEGVAVGDKLAVVFKGTVVTSAVPATEVTGEKVTARNETTRTFKIDGAEQKADHKLAAIPAIGAINGAFYANPNGYIIGSEAASTPEVVQTDFVYVVKIQTKEAETGDMINGASAAVAKADAIFSDGTHKTIDLTITTGKYWMPNSSGEVGILDGGKYVAKEVKTADSGPVGAWFSYTESTDGSYNLLKLDETVAAVAGADINLTKGQPKELQFGTDKAYTTSATKIVSIAKTTYAATTLTGLVDATLDYDVANKAVLYTRASKTGNQIAAIYAVDQAGATVAPTLVYNRAIAPGDTVEGGIEWTFYVNGKIETYVIEASSTPTGGKVYELKKNDKADTYQVGSFDYSVTPATWTEDADIAYDKTAAVVALVDATYFIADGVTYNVTANTAIFDVRTGHTGEAATLAANMKVDVVKNATGAAVVYIVGVVG